MQILTKFWQKCNLSIKIGYISLMISLLFLVIALILLATAQFDVNDSNQPVSNGFYILKERGVSSFFSSSKLQKLRDWYAASSSVSQPLAQMVFACIFLIILLPIAGSICILALIVGYFLRWLYT